MHFICLLTILSIQSEVHSYWLSTQYRVPSTPWQFNTVNGQFSLNRFSISFNREIFPNAGIFVQGDILYGLGDTLSIQLLSTDFRENKMKYLDTTRSGERWLLRGMIQRGYVSYTGNRFNILLGRFLPTQGYGYFYSPTDVYRTRQKLAIDPEFLPGIDAIEATVYPFPDWKMRLLIPSRYENKPVSFTSILLVKNLEIFIALNRKSPGLGFSLPILGGLIRGELARSGEFLSWDLTYDRFFRDDIYVLIEVLRTNDITFTGLTIPSVGKGVEITSLYFRKGFPMGTSVELTVLLSNRDRSTLWIPRIYHELNDYFSLEGRVYMSIGKRGSLFDPYWILPVLTFGLGAYF